MIKTYAAFIENVIHPILDKFSDIIWYAESKGIPITKESLTDLANRAGKLFIIHTILYILMYITITCVICFTAIQVLKC